MSSIPDLVQKLTDATIDRASGFKLLQQLMRLKDDGVDLALAEVAKGRGEMAHPAAEALEKRAKKGSVPAIESLIALPDQASERGVVARCLQALGGLKDEQAFTALLGYCDPAFPERASAASTLQERVGRDKSVRGDARVADAFLRVISDRDCRRDAVMGLELTKDRRAVTPLLAYLEDDDVNVRILVLVALAAIGDRAALAPIQSYRDRAPANAHIGIDRAIKALNSSR